ncbi:DUF6970 domain-containing protein [Aequorivita sublithincola]|nr:hypothetical protein [Aequorivita sublithincola]
MESDAANPIIEKVTATDAIFAEENKENVVIQTQIPQCISERIEEIKNGEKRNPPTIVTEYSVNEKKYYVIPPGCCDQYDYIIDENCKIVCSQGVGIDGKYKRTCGNILNYATTRVIWRDLR